ncbi:MAG: TolC family protein [Burkholderiales bacterium]|nr:TolC family protein [Burkholderiales bacterium]
MHTTKAKPVTRQDRSQHRPVRAALVALVLPLVLASCAATRPPSTVENVQRLTRALGGISVEATYLEADRSAVDRRVAGLLVQPLSAETAVEVALLNNRGLQATLAELGVADAELLEASRLPNPGLTISRPRSGANLEIEHSMHYSLARLLLLPLLKRTEEARFEQTQRAVALEVLTLASETRKAYFQAVAAAESLRYLAQVKEAAEASAELARRMAEAGNFSRLQRAREQAFYADATVNLARAQQVSVAARERLIRLLGLWGEQTALTLPERLPELPATLPERLDLERTALAQRLDVLTAKYGAERTARNLGLTRTTRFLNLLDLGVTRKSSEGSASSVGYELSIELPLFDWGESRIEKAEAYYMQAVNRAAETAVNARSEVREAYLAWRTAYDVARHYRDEMVPLAKRISDENLLRYNGMLIGVFELLADMRAQISTVSAAITAQRDFWLASADLDMALVGKPNLTPPSGPIGGSGAATGGAGH